MNKIMTLVMAMCIGLLSLTASPAMGNEAGEPVGSTYAFAEQGDCDSPGYIQINYVKGADWTIEGESVVVDDPSSRFTYPGGIQAEVTATAQDGYFISDGQRSTYFLQVNPQPTGSDCEAPPVNTTPKVTECRGVLSGERLRNVVVPSGASCTLIDSHVSGSVRSTGGRNVTLADTTVQKNIRLSKISGDVTFGSKGHPCRHDPFVGGSLIVKKSHNVLICQASVSKNIVVKRNDGKITVRDSSANKIKVRKNSEFVRDSGDSSHNRLSIIRLINVDGEVIDKRNSPRRVAQR